MKQLLVIVIGLGIIGGVVALLNNGNTMEVVNPEIERVEIEKEVVVDAFEMRIKEAQDAARDTIQAKAQDAYDAAYEHEMKTIEAQVLKDVEAEIKARRIETEKATGAYWLSEANIRQLIREVFPEEPNVAIEVARRESGGTFSMGQSKLRYPEDKPEWGVEAGDREQSFCFFQIHAPAHDATAKRLGLEDYKTNVESCVKMARVIYDDRGGFYAWTEYHKMLAMR